MLLDTHDGSGEGWATLDVRKFPFIVGNSPESASWECPCGEILATGLYARQVLNLLIRCGGCSRVLETPCRTPGQPIAGRPVYIPPGGTYLLGGELDVRDKPVMMVGHDALAGYAKETGRLLPEIYDPDLAPVLTNLDAESIGSMADDICALLGDDYERLEMADARGRRSKTPPPNRHRLIELIEFARRAADELSKWDGAGQISLDGNLLAESITVLAATRRWRHHPAWPTLRSSLASETEPPHTVMLLTVASYLVDANNGVGVHVNTSRQNVATADMWIEPDLSQRVDLEVKTPQALRGPQVPITEPHAVAILERTLKKSGRQRRNTRSSLLVVGGYHLGPSYDVMVSTAKAMLALEHRRWRGLAGIVIVDCTYEDRRTDLGQTTFTPVARTEIARHPGYGGDLSIETGLPPSVGLLGGAASS